MLGTIGLQVGALALGGSGVWLEIVAYKMTKEVISSVKSPSANNPLKKNLPLYIALSSISLLSLFVFSGSCLFAAYWVQKSVIFGSAIPMLPFKLMGISFVSFCLPLTALYKAQLYYKDLAQN